LKTYKQKGIYLMGCKARLATTAIWASFFILTTALSVHSAVIKKTSSGICHPEDSSYYSRIKNFTSYQSLDACLESGGRLPKTYSSSSQADREENWGYSRSKFGHGWSDMDGDCQDSRQETLVAQSTAPVRFESNDKCRVASGRWISPFTGKVIHDPSAMDIDHVVPLKWAWKRGADKWSDSKREQFANDPANLISVELSLNRQKGAKGPAEWLPPANQCEYVLRFIRVAKKYGLQTTAALSKVRQQVCSR
jgi:hypothetical protein